MCSRPCRYVSVYRASNVCPDHPVDEASPTLKLILISGFPSSGKTYRSVQLINHLNDRISKSPDPKIQRLKVVHVSDHSLALSRAVYATARAEKDARAAFSSAVKRALARDTIVVADGMNYIKGFRYQLYCEAKAVQTPSCVVHVGTQREQCKLFNDAKLADGSGGYEPEVFENLVFRYEEPNGMARWDSPLFAVPFEDVEPPCDAIWDAMVGSDGKTKVVRPNAATVLQPATEQNYLYELDKITSDVIALITDWQRDHPSEGGGEIKVQDAEAKLQLPLSPPTLPQLQRLRRQFVALNRMHQVDKTRIAGLFVERLNAAFEEG